MFNYFRQPNASPKKTTFRKPPYQDLVASFQAVSLEGTAVDPLDSVRTQAYRDARRAADFNVEKVYTAKEFFRELDKKLTGGQIGDLTACTGGVKILWNKRLTKTAGLADCKRGLYPSATIELSEKIIDDQERLLNTVAHEFCHVANTLIDGDYSHGSGFKKWGEKCEVAFKDRGIRVKTTHDYSSKFEYIWTCTNQECGKEVGYHSKEHDPEKDGCRRCGGDLVQTNPVARVLKSRRKWDTWGWSNLQILDDRQPQHKNTE